MQAAHLVAFYQNRTEVMPSVQPNEPMPCDASRDHEYVQQYSADIRKEILGSLCQRWVNRRAAQPHTPNTGNVTIPSPEEAGHALLREATRYYQASRRPMPNETCGALQALQRSLHDPAQCITALSDALLCFVHSLAVVEDGALREAVRSAQLCLKSLQSTWAELPAVTSDSWLIGSHEIIVRGKVK